MTRDRERLLTHPLIRASVGLLGFRISRFLFYSTITRLLIAKNDLGQLSKTVEGYFTRYVAAGNPNITPKSEVFIYHYKMKLCEDITLLNLNRCRLPRVLARNVRVEGTENYRRALEAGKGILAVGSHVGSVLLATAAFVNISSTVAHPLSRRVNICTDPYAIRFFPPRTIHDTYAFIPNDLNRQAMIARIVAALKSREVVMTNLDVLSGGSSTEGFRLFNKTNILLPAVVASAKLALLAEAVVLPWRNRRDERNRLVLRLENPIWPNSDIQALSEQLRSMLEKWILENPEQWIYWDRFHKRLIEDETV